MCEKTTTEATSVSSSIPSFNASDADEYERFMARWSTRMADPFLTFAGVKAGQRVLDVGCGTGTVTLALANRGCEAVGLDASEPYLEGARRRRSHTSIVYECGDARSLTYPAASFDACVSLLAIDVIPEPDRVVAEMRRVTRKDGIVACATSDFWGGTSASDLIIDTASVFDEGMSELRTFLRARPLARANGQAELWQKAGLAEVVEVPIVLSFDYTSFEDYWSSRTTGPSRGAQRMMAIPTERRALIERHVRSGYLAGQPDGPRSFAMIIRAVRGLVP
jgi:SAM-dependent methyltransferase